MCGCICFGKSVSRYIYICVYVCVCLFVYTGMYVCMCVYLVLSSLNVLTPLEYFVGGVAFDSDSQLPRPLGFWLYVVSLDALFWQTVCILFLYGGCMYIVGLWSRYICLYSLYGYILHCVFSFGLGLPFFPFDISRPRGWTSFPSWQFSLNISLFEYLWFICSGVPDFF